MKFGKTLKKVSEQDPEYGAMYLQYKLLRKFLKEHTGDTQTQVLFMQMLEKEHTRVSKVVTIKLQELQMTGESLMTSVHALKLSRHSAEELAADIATLTHHADDLASHLAALDKFVFYNKEAFRKIVKKHDKLTSVSLSWLEAQRRSVFVDAQEDLEQVLVHLSDIYRFIKENSTAGLEEGEHKVSDDTFERKSHKYWVTLQDVFQFKVKVIKHLPLHFFSRKKNKKDRSSLLQDLLMEQPKDGENLQHHGWITSIYMDNDDMDCYRTRINMEEAATLFRVRWYGDPNDLHMNDGMVLPRAPVKGLYYERKTHHEGWVDLPSTKERFPIGFDQVLPFMDGKLKPDTFVKEGKTRDLANAFQEEVVKRKLHPVIRTAYKRTAFQHDDTNDVRITLDTQLTFVDENPRYLKADEWKRSEEDIEKDLDSELFPFAVLEVKLKSEPPAWLKDIINEPYIRQVSKFSKFQQSCCTFYPHGVSMFPYWYNEEDITKIKDKHDGKKAMEEDRAGYAGIADEYAASRVQHVADVTLDMPATSSTTAVQSYTNDAYERDSVALSMGDERKVFRDPTYDVIATIQKNGKPSGGPRPPVVERGEDFGGITGTKRGVTSKKGKKQKKSSVATSRLKVEPKTHFANERTFLQWLRIGMTLFSLGGVIFNLTSDDSARISGLVFMGLSAIIITYGMGMYYWRMWMINTRKMLRFYDKFGPAMLVVFIMAALVVNLVLVLVYDQPAP